MSQKPCLHCLLSETIRAYGDAGEHLCLNTVIGAAINVVMDVVASSPAQMRDEVVEVARDQFERQLARALDPNAGPHQVSHH